MADFNPAGTMEATRKLAGRSDARQVRDVKYGTNITWAKFRFLALMADAVPGEDGKVKKISPTISSRAVTTLTPEKIDTEVAPTTFAVTVASAAVGVGDSGSVTLDNVQGMEVDQLINNPAQNAMGRITGISGNVVTFEVVHSAGGAVAWDVGASGLKNLELLNVASTDAPEMNRFVNREGINRTNNIQLSWKAMAQGILQKNLSLYANMNGQAPNDDWKQEMKLGIVDFNRRRENQMILSQEAVTVGTGATRRLISKGMIGFAGSVVPNDDAQGALNFEKFSRVHMSAARESGGSFEIFGLCGNTVATVINQIFFNQTRIISKTVNEEFRTSYQVIETPQGILKLILCDAMDSDARQGQLLTFHADDLERTFLKGLDMKVMEDIELPTILGTRAALVVAECLLPSNPEGIKLHTNILKAA